MNRRNFFKTVGIPALALPFVKWLPKFESEKPSNFIPKGWKPTFASFNVSCPRCKRIIRFPYIKGTDSITYKNLGFVCTKCQRPFYKTITLKVGGFKAYWHKDKVFL